MPFELVCSGKPAPKPVLRFADIDSKVEAKLEEARQEDFMRQHPEGARCSGDPFRPGTRLLINPAHVMTHFQLKKSPIGQPEHLTGVAWYTMISNTLYQTMCQFPHENLQFFPAQLIHSNGTLQYWIYRHIRYFDCIDKERSQYKLNTSPDGKSWYARPPEEPTLYITKACLGDTHFWIDAYARHILISDTLGQQIKPFLPIDVTLKPAEWC